jgi:hypothetical protein
LEKTDDGIGLLKRIPEQVERACPNAPRQKVLEIAYKAWAIPYMASRSSASAIRKLLYFTDWRKAWQKIFLNPQSLASLTLLTKKNHEL